MVGTQVSVGRSLTPLTITVLTFPLLGILSLLIADRVSSTTGIGSDARELVLASQTALWSVLMAALVGSLSRFLEGGRPTYRPLTFVPAILAAFLAVVLSYISVATTRGGGVFDFDAQGLVAWVPSAFVGISALHLGAAMMPPHAARVWLAALVVVTIASMGLIVASLPGQPLATSSILIVSAAFVVLAAWMRARPSRSGSPASQAKPL